MANRLAGSISPYLRAHADNPVDWWPWGPEALAEAVRRDVPLFISIGYATCHWCHVMARESFTDPVVADYLNEHFVAIKVDREEHPEVDASYLAQAGAFTRDLGWPLSIFADRAGVAFFAATYLPPQPIGQVPAFRQVLEAATEAWTERRGDIAGQAAALIEALADSADRGASPLPDAARLNHVAVDMASYEDPEQGGFGTAPKFPVVPALQFLLDNGSAMAVDLAERTLVRMAQSPLRDSIDGGFFRYATQRDWSEPHYERMLYDNALLLKTYAGLAILRPSARAVAEDSARGIARFLTETMAVDGGFASAQDSESTIDGRRVEGEYYTVPRAERELLEAPPLDAKVLTGWNGLAIEALAVAGFRLGVPEWIAVAAEVADGLLADHVLPSGLLVRASLAGEASEAVATLEDYGMFAGGLLALAEVTGEVRFAVAARGLIDACLTGDGSAFTAPGGADPVLAASGLAVIADPSEGAYPSGLSAIGLAALRLYRLTDDRRYLDAVTASCASVIALALDAPISFGATLSIAQQLAMPVRQLLVVGDRELASVAAEWRNLTATIAAGTPFQMQELEAAGFELYAARRDNAAYLCEAFSCRLPITDPDTLREALVL